MGGGAALVQSESLEIIPAKECYNTSVIDAKEDTTRGYESRQAKRSPRRRVRGAILRHDGELRVVLQLGAGQLPAVEKTAQVAAGYELSGFGTSRHALADEDEGKGEDKREWGRNVVGGRAGEGRGGEGEGGVACRILLTTLDARGGGATACRRASRRSGDAYWETADDAIEKK